MLLVKHGDSDTSKPEKRVDRLGVVTSNANLNLIKLLYL